jgi:N-acetylneuraminate lyase
MNSRNSLAGIVVPLVTPFDDEGSLAPELVNSLLEFHLDVGVHGFYVGGSTGEGFLQSTAERCEYLRHVSDVCRQRTTLVAQVGALSSRDAWTLSEHAAQCGYDIVSSTPPFYFTYTERELIAYYQELAERSPLPVLLYNSPASTGCNLSVDAQIEMLKLPNVIGSKHTDKDFFAAERLIRNVPDTQIINGPDEMLTAGLAMGMVGGIGSTYNLMPHRYLEIFSLVQSGDLEQAREIQSGVNDQSFSATAERAWLPVTPAHKDTTP